jgi:hypothetical protein
MLGRIPETYEVRKVVEALIQELVKEDILHRSQVDFIIEKGKPKTMRLLLITVRLRIVPVRSVVFIKRNKGAQELFSSVL